MTGIPFPDIDPIALSIGPLSVRWYGLSYLAGFLGGWAYSSYLADLDRDRRPNRVDIDNVLPFLVFAVILGGRLGYVLFYNLGFYLENPLDVFKVWEGGMSFHGGLLGVAAVCVVYAWRNKFSILAMGDIIAAATPIGFFFGRIANFINGELFGRVTTVPWGVIFPYGGGLPRHPSQLYEAILEGVVLFLVLFFMAKRPGIRRAPGVLFGTLLIGYALCRILVEYFREPDPQIGLILNYFSMGQLLSLPMIAAGVTIIIYAKKTKTI